jgi:hypothetical protein
MKMKVTYEEADIKRLIRNNLAKQGIAATDADIEFKKNQAVVSVEVSGEDEPLSEPAPPSPTIEQRINHTHDVMTRPDMGRSLPAPPPPPAPPKEPLQVVEGGANPVDMSDVLGASMRIARNTEGPFPKPDRQLMEGESFDFPGDKA